MTEKKIALNLGERFALLEILPREGNFATLKIVRKLREMLSLSEEEIKEYKVEQVGDQIKWIHPERTKGLEFGEFAEQLIKTQLEKLDKESKLTDRHFKLYEQFVEEKSKVEAKKSK